MIGAASSPFVFKENGNGMTISTDLISGARLSQTKHTLAIGGWYDFAI